MHTSVLVQLKKLAATSDVVLDMETKSKSVTTSKIKQKVLGKGSDNFLQFADEFLNKIEISRSVGYYRRAKAAVTKLKKYYNKDVLLFDDLDVAFINRYETYLRDVLDNEVNTIHGNMKIIRKIINEAVQQEIFNIDQNPFLKIRLKTKPSTIAYLSDEELKKIENLELDPAQLIWHHRNIYVLPAMPVVSGSLIS